MSRYSKSVLTVIGLCLLWLCVREPVRPAAGEAARAPSGKVIQAGRFELVDKDGKARGAFSASGGLVLLDRSAKPRVRLAVSDEAGVGLEFLEAGGEVARAALRVSAEGASSLTVVDRENKPRAKLNVEAGGATELRLYGGNRRLRVGLSVGPDGPSSLFFYDSKGKPCAEFAVAADDSAELVLYDRDGRPRARFGVSKDGEPRLVALDAANKRRVAVDASGLVISSAREAYLARLGVREDGTLRLRLRGDGGQADLSAGKAGASLELSHAKDKSLVRLRAASDGSSDLTLVDRKGNLRGGLYVRKTGEVDLKFSDNATTPRAWLRVDKQPHLEFYDPKGRCRTRMELKEDGSPSLELPKKGGKPLQTQF